MPDTSAVAPPPLPRILEALLFVGGPPLTLGRACEAIRGLTPEHFLLAIEQLNRAYRRQGRPYRVQPRDEGSELRLQPRFRAVADRLQGSQREARLSPATLDVLALVAYQQPASRLELESLRGSDAGSILRQLVRLGLVAIQRGEAKPRDVLYVTTPRFLTLFALRSLDDLPRTQDLQQL